MFLYLLAIIPIGFVYTKFSVFISLNIQSKNVFLSFKIFLLNFDDIEVEL